MRYRSLPRHLARELRDVVTPSLTPRLQFKKRPMATVTVARSMVPRLSPAGAFLRQVDDRRSFHPDGFFRPAKLVSGISASINAGRTYSLFGTPKRQSMPVGVKFKVPSKTVICIRRKMRKEVILALGHSGKGGKKRRRNWYSNVRC